MKYFLLVLALTGILIACDEEKEPPVPKEKLEKILTDIHLAEVYSTLLDDSAHYSANRNIDSLALYYKTILEHHKVSVEDFNTTMEWYTVHSQEFDSVYTAIQPVINKMEAEHPAH